MRHHFRTPSLGKASRALALVFALFYLGFHAVSGERGLVALFKETRRLESLKAELAEATAKREAYEHKIKLLSAASLDLDMLDEQSRHVLGFAAKDEVVVMLQK